MLTPHSKFLFVNMSEMTNKNGSDGPVRDLSTAPGAAALASEPAGQVSDHHVGAGTGGILRPRPGHQRSVPMKAGQRTREMLRNIRLCCFGLSRDRTRPD